MSRSSSAVELMDEDMPEDDFESYSIDDGSNAVDYSTPNGRAATEQSDDSESSSAQAFVPAAYGLKEISNLGRFTVSSHKPGNGVDELRGDDLTLFWQSDGPQPHKLTVYFIKRVGIRDIRFYVDANEDESYTPVRVIFKAGPSENSLIDFASMELNDPVGWQVVPVAGAGGGADGNTLYAWVLQMQILENHQNGKDTHLRGFKIYALESEDVASAEAEAYGGGGIKTKGTEGAQEEAEEDSDGAVAEKDGFKELINRLEKEMADINWGQVDSAVTDLSRDPEIR